MTITPPQARRGDRPPGPRPTAGGSTPPGAARRDREEGADSPPRGPVARSIAQRSASPLVAAAAQRATRPLIPVVDEAKQKLAPVVHAGLALSAVAMTGTSVAQNPGSTGALALATVVSGPASWYLSRRTVAKQMARLGAERQARARRFIAAAATATTGWLTSASAFGVDPATAAGKINITVGGLIGLWAASPYVRFRNQPRLAPPPPPAEQPQQEQPPLGWAVQAAERQARWRERVAIQNGALPGTSLQDGSLVEIDGGWTATIVSDNPGSFEPGRFVAATGRVAAAFEIGVADVAIEAAAGNASQAQLTVLHENPLVNFQFWPGPYAMLGADSATLAFDTTTGVAIVGVYPDGDLVRYRFWNAGGAWHDLISGATGSGKSEFVNLLLALERHAAVEVPVLDDAGQPKIDEHGNIVKVKKGLIVSRIIDPQWGQSFGDWQDHVDWFAPTIDEARILLQKTEREMLTRNKHFGRQKWYDEKNKRWRRGVKNFVPTPEMPLLAITVDEAHLVLKDPECARIVADLGKMGRKVGIKLRLITQVPLLQELGNNMAIRDAVASGNVIVFRTANALSGQVAFNGALPAQPNTIPREWPKGLAKQGQETTAGLGYALGASARSAIMRAFYPGDAIDWIYRDGEAWGVPGELDPLTRAAGTGYEDRHRRLEELDDITDVDLPLPAPNAARAAGLTCDQAILDIFLAHAADDHMIKMEDLLAALNGGWGTRRVSQVLSGWERKGWSISGKPRLQHGWHQLTPKGREEAPAELAREGEENPAAAEQREMVGS